MKLDKKQFAHLEKELFLCPITSKEHLKNWVYYFLDIDLPDGTIYPLSNSSPADAIWEAYKFIANNEGKEGKRGFVWLSSRDSYKTLSQSILNVLLLLHFRITIAHMAAIESQSHKAIQYLRNLILKLKPYLDMHGIVIDNQSKRMITLKFPDGEEAYVRVIIATLQGTNSEHTLVMTIDEIDVISDIKILHEASSIPSMQKNIYPLVIKTSTRKFAGGIMEQQVKNASKNKEKLLQWNIIDLTEYCPDERNQKSNPQRVELYIRPFKLPLSTLTPEEYENLTPAESKLDYVKIEAPLGCAACPILPLCQTKLSERHPSQTGGLYRPIQFVINEFQTKEPDYAEAQLLCLAPSKTGLVYPRFDPTPDSGNVLTLNKAYEMIFGIPYPGQITFDVLLETVKKELNIKFYAGIDWGYTHDSAIVIVGVFPNFSILFETFSSPGLELSDLLTIAKKLNEKYGGIYKWYADQAAPANIATFRKAGFNMPDFKKDVLGGIEALRSQILNGNVRRFFVLDTPENARTIEMFQNHVFNRRADGTLTSTPDDGPYADIADALRYVAQNLYNKTQFKPLSASEKNSLLLTASQTNLPHAFNHEFNLQEEAKRRNQEIMRQKIQEHLDGNNNLNEIKSSKNKKIFW